MQGRRRSGALALGVELRRGLTTAVGTALAAGLLAAAPVALASNGGGNDRDVRAAGSCTLRSTAKIKLSPENGRIEVEFEVDENRVGKTWSVVVNRNGTRVLARKATTNARSGSFEVRTVVSRGTPRTNVTAVARRAATGEVCRATASI